MKEYLISEVNNWKDTLKIGDQILLTGTVYTARDAAHKRILKLISDKQSLPFELNGAFIYYAGPTAAKPGMPIGSCGPTTSSRMDIYTPTLLGHGLICMIGKGQRNKTVVDSIKLHKALYLCAVGGAGALIAKTIKSCDVVAFPELGCESIKKLEVVKMPVIVGVNVFGEDIFAQN